MKTWAHISNDEVAEIFEFDDTFKPGENILVWITCVEVTGNADAVVGSKYLNGIFTKPAPIAGSSPTPPITVATLKAYAAQVRYSREIAGVTYAGSAIATDRASQSLITGAIVLLRNDTSVDNIEFKQSDGTWVDIPRTNMIAIGMAIGNYVQSCFSAERDVDNAIDAKSITTNAGVDSFAWPSTTINPPSAPS